MSKSMEKNVSDNVFSTMKEMTRDCMNEIQTNAAKLTASGISTGFSRVDDLTGGLENGRLYVIGGRPSMGKEEFMLSMIRTITLESELPVLLFVTNHRKEDYAARLVSLHCNLPSLYMKKGELGAREWDRLDGRIGTLVDAPLSIYESLDLKLDDLLEKARYGVREKGIRVIFVECLQMVDFACGDASRSERIVRVMFALKEFARQENLPVVVGAMLGRPSEDREGIEGLLPRLSDLALSSSIEELADVVMLVHRPEYYCIYEDYHGRDLHGLMQILVRKNALKPCGEVYVRYQQETGMISPMEKAEDSDAWDLDDLKANNKAIDLLVDALHLEDIAPF